jgi:hypothetical protein
MTGGPFCHILVRPLGNVQPISDRKARWASKCWVLSSRRARGAENARKAGRGRVRGPKFEVSGTSNPERQTLAHA